MLRTTPIVLMCLLAALPPIVAGADDARGAVVVTRDLEYARVGDKRLLLDLYLPTADAPPPLVVWIHGGGWRQGSKDRVRLAWLADKGYALASINYRLSHEATFPAQIHDCKGAIRWLRANQQRLGFDATKIGVAGSSAGGHLVALLGTSAGVEALEGEVGGNLDQSSRVQAVIDYYGPSDFLEMARAKRGGKGAVTRLLGGEPHAVPELAALGSPATHVTADDAPFLILHGTEDRLVPVGQSRLLDEKLDAAQVPSDLRILEGAGHGGRAFEADSLKSDLLTFLDHHLRGRRAVVTPTADASTATIIETLSKPGVVPVQALANLKLRDEARSKDLDVRVTYPTSKGSFPMIIWSHGAFGSKDRYGPLVEHWAQRGYVVIQANHADSTAPTGGRPDPSTLRLWAERPKDVKQILDSLPTLAEQLPDFVGTLDVARIGVGGHSFGAHTAQLMGGARTATGPGGAYVSHADPRVRAALVLSGQGRGEALDEGSWETLTVPSLVMTGTKDDSGRTGKPYTWRKEPYTYAPAGDKTFILIDRAHHGFGGITGPGRRGRAAGPENAAHVQAAQATTLLFWEAYLRGDLGAKLLLRSRRIERETSGAVSIEFE